jgi:hypothetical protein
MQDQADEWHDAGPAEGANPYGVLKRWEKLRLLYNAVLIPWSVLNIMAFRPGGGDPGLWEDVILGGLAANVCFCLGPVLETYLAWLGANPRAARGWLFALGTAFTALAAAVAISGFGA